MKKEYFIFIILILAAAIVSGSTLCFFSNFKYISQQIKVQQQQTKASQAADSADSGLSDQTAKADMPSAASDSTQQLALSSTNAETLVSQTDQNEIDAMLDAVDTNGNEEDYSLRIKNFQKKNALPITGVMDTQTLNALINRATLQRAIEHLE